MLDALVNIVISLINGFTAMVDGAWTTIAPPDGVVQGAVAYLWTLDNIVPVSDLFVIVGLLGTMAAFSVVLKFGQKLLDWLPKG